MGPVLALKAESRAQICLQILDLPDICNKCLVNFLLVFYPQGIRLLLLCSLPIFEEVLLALSILFLPRPVFVFAHAIQDLAVHACDIDYS
jgi:hypothetical protein